MKGVLSRKLLKAGRRIEGGVKKRDEERKRDQQRGMEDVVTPYLNIAIGFVCLSRPTRPCPVPIGLLPPL